MEFERLEIPEVILFKPKIFSDQRGFFFESFKAALFKEVTGLDLNFVQDNHSQSVQGALRGLHYQLPPFEQGKLVRVSEGEIFDVAVDLRQSSATFGQWVGTLLSEQNHHQLWIPPGFAHGFITKSKIANVSYKLTDYYHPQSERSIRYDDPTLNITWHFNGSPLVAPKDLSATSFLKADYFD